MARVPETARIQYMGLWLLLHSNNLVPNSVRLFRGPSRQPRNSAHSGDAMSDRGVDGPAVGRMLRLGSMAATFSDSRSRQPVWRDVRAPHAASWHWASANTFQGASSECDFGALG